jgi:hypothetical protein
MPSPPAVRSTLRTNVAKPVKSDFSFDAGLTVETVQSLDRETETAYGGYYLLQTKLAYVPWKVSATAIVALNQDYRVSDPTKPLDTAFDNPVFLIGKEVASKTLLFDSIVVGLRGELPGNKPAYNAGFQGSVGSLINVAKALGDFEFALQFRYLRSSYNQEIASNGTVNAPDQTRWRFNTKYNFTEKFNVLVSIAYLWFMSYENVPRGYEASAAMLGYDFTKHLGIAAGIMTNRGTLDEAGDEHFKFYDSKSTYAVFDINLSF